MLCEQAREHLSAYLDGELAAALSAAVRSHVDTCPDCRRLLEELRATADLLGQLPLRGAPAEFAQDVQRLVERRTLLDAEPHAESPVQERTLALRRARFWPRALAVAATVVLAAGIGLFAWLGQTARVESPSSGTMTVADGRSAGKFETRREEVVRGLDLFLDRESASSRTGLADKARAEAEAIDGYGYAEAGADGGKMSWSFHDLASKADGVAAWDEAGRGGGTGNVEADLTPLTGTVNLEDAAGRQTIFGDSVGARSSTSAPVAVDVTKETDELGLQVASLESNGRRHGGRAAGTVASALAIEKPAAEAASVLTQPAGEPPEDGLMLGKLEVAKRMPDWSSSDTKEKASERGLGASALGAYRRMEDGPKAVQLAMNFVAQNRVAIDKLQAVATPDNLGRAPNQLVVHAESRGKANRELKRLFLANGWRALDDAPAQGAAKDARVATETTDANGLRAAATVTEASRKQAEQAVAGVYFLAEHDGEDTWVVLTDRDNLSRFSTQLAQVDAVTVGLDSSDQFHAINQLQNHLRRFAATADDGALSKAPARRGQANGQPEEPGEAAGKRFRPEAEAVEADGDPDRHKGPADTPELALGNGEELAQVIRHRTDRLDEWRGRARGKQDRPEAEPGYVVAAPAAVTEQPKAAQPQHAKPTGGAGVAPTQQPTDKQAPLTAAEPAPAKPAPAPTQGQKLAEATGEAVRPPEATVEGPEGPLVAARPTPRAPSPGTPAVPAKPPSFGRAYDVVEDRDARGQAVARGTLARPAGDASRELLERQEVAGFMIWPMLPPLENQVLVIVRVRGPASAGQAAGAEAAEAEAKPAEAKTTAEQEKAAPVEKK